MNMVILLVMIGGLVKIFAIKKERAAAPLFQNQTILYLRIKSPWQVLIAALRLSERQG